MKKKIINLFTLLFIASLFVFVFDWSVDGFDFFKFQHNEYYFQSWISIAGSIFTFIMAITIFVIYKKSKINSLKFISLSLLLVSVAYSIIGYHSSYCKVCSDLSMCAASHNYPNYFIVIALIALVVTVLLANIRNNINLLKLLALGLMFSTIGLTVILFMSVEFMETPDAVSYVFKTLNLQGFVFIFPLLLIILLVLYFRKIYKFSNISLFIFMLIFVSFLPQAYHVFICNDCHIMECSEFFVASGLLMFMAMGLLIYSLSLELHKKV